MAAVSVTVSLLLTLIFFVHYISDTPHLREATLRLNVTTIAEALSRGENPVNLRLYREYPGAYGFRVFDRRLLAKRHVLASANTRWLPPVQHLASTRTDPDGSRDLNTAGSDLLEGFERFHPRDVNLGGHVVSRLIHRVVVSDHKYWVQAYMVGDPAWAGLAIIADKLISHVLFPVLFLVPALTLAIFLTTRAALRPLRGLSHDANLIASAVARGQTLVPVSEQGMAQEFSDVAAAINAMLTKLERSLQLQKQFTSDAAHELRTPLAVLLLEVAQLPPSPLREQIKTDLVELGELVNELLRFAQAEDAMAHELYDVDVVAVARKVCEDAVTMAIGRGQAIEFDTPVPVSVLRGSVTLIEIAIRNLVENALKYSPDGAKVSVRVEAGPTIMVEDRGPGIPVQQRQAIFDRFWRAGRQVGNGAGIGLALVRRIAQLHDGEISLEDGALGGTRMILRFAPVQAGRSSLQWLHGV